MAKSKKTIIEGDLDDVLKQAVKGNPKPKKKKEDDKKGE